MIQTVFCVFLRLVEGHRRHLERYFGAVRRKGVRHVWWSATTPTCCANIVPAPQKTLTWSITPRRGTDTGLSGVRRAGRLQPNAARRFYESCRRMTSTGTTKCSRPITTACGPLTLRRESTYIMTIRVDGIIRCETLFDGALT
jgi:hypothetical protein